MNISRRAPMRACGVVCLSLSLTFCMAVELTADTPKIQFDFSPLAVATPVEPSDPAMLVPGHRLVAVSLQLSTLVHAGDLSVDRLMITIHSDDPAIRVADYSPRTELSSNTDGEIDVQQTVEQNKHLGLTVAAKYGHLVEGNLGGDIGKKNLETLKFKRVAPLHVVAASGTTNRGRGVYFKLRSTATQVLEGDKTFSITFAVPEGWQGGLLDVTVSAESAHRPFPGIERQVQTVGEDLFTVAMFSAGDSALQGAALQLVNAEAELRSITGDYRDAIVRETKSNFFDHVAAAFDRERSTLSDDWLRRVLRGDVDSRLHRDLRRLPVDVRVAILDYVDARRRFLASDATVNDVVSQ